LQGPLNIIPEEYPAISTLAIDIAADVADVADVAGTSRIGAALQAWLGSTSAWPSGQLLCWRQGRFWQRRVSTLLQTQALQHSLPKLTRQSRVLITGANGGMGRAIARHIAEVYQCTLLLQVRKPVPARADWATHIATNGSEASFLLLLQALEAAGSQVVVLAADLADQTALEQAFAPVLRLVAAGNRIDWVFHTAGRGEGALIQLRSEAESLATLGPKVNGTRFLCLHRKQLGDPTLLLFSSLGNLLPKEKVGQVAYVAANACLEAWATQVRSEGGRALAIAWDDWAESGMATRSAQQLDSALGRSGVSTDAVGSELATETGLIWRTAQSTRHDWWLDEHRIDQHTTVMPAMGMLALVQKALQAIRATANAAQQTDPGIPATAGTPLLALHNVVIEQPLVAIDGAEPDLVVAFDADLSSFELYCGQGEFSRAQWQRHANGKIRPAPIPVSLPEPAAARQNLFRAADGNGVSPKAALLFGPRWQTVVAVDRIAHDSLLIELRLPAAFQGEAAAIDLHVALLDTATLIDSPLAEDIQFAPISIGGFTRYAPMCDHLYSHVQIRELGENRLLQVRMIDAAGNLLVSMDDLLLVNAGAALREAKHNVMRLAEDAAQRAELQFVTRSETRRAPAEHEVEIEVRAAGLNFKDVLIALGVLPEPTDPAMTFGQEAAGIITRVGSAVTDLQAGDRVLCAGHSCFAQYVIMPRRVVAKIPPVLGYAEAAGVPVAFTTAWLALRHTAHIRQGERVLIHSAASGVGMAALQIALHLGAEVWVTAGSEEKRQILLGMGARAAADSRSREFGNTFRQQLGARPFDVILNALAGDLLEESLSLLAPQGRFLELGLRDILQNFQLGLSIFAEGGSFHAVQAGAEHPAYVEAWAEVLALLEQQVLRPLPTTRYEAHRTGEAFRSMAQGKHIGKLVICMPERAQAQGFATKLRTEGLTDAEGVRIAMAMAILAPQVNTPWVAISRLPIGVVLEKQAGTRQMLFSSADANPASNNGPDGAEASLQGADSATLLAAMRTMLECFLGEQGLDVDASFFALGATSLDLIQFAKRLEQRMGREIPVTLLFKAASLRELANELAPQATPAADAEAAATAASAASLEDKRRSLQARRKLRGTSSQAEHANDE
jgi:NADPH:quinone reductase-like Zn-dependent oxidoreductase/acyl carrier protein